jgi:hypothetical protein
VVDVRDVAAAHIAAFELGNVWSKRTLLVGGNPHWAEIAGYIHHAVPEAMKANVRDTRARTHTHTHTHIHTHSHTLTHTHSHTHTHLARAVPTLSLITITLYPPFPTRSTSAAVCL